MYRKWGLAVLLLLLALATCGSPQKMQEEKSGTGAKQGTRDATKAAAEPDMLTVGHVGHDHQLALYVAALEGERLRAKFGVGLREVKAREIYDLLDGDTTVARLRLMKVGGGAEMPTAMACGDIQIGLGGTIPVAKMADAGTALKILCPLQTDGDMLVLKKGIEAPDWKAFVAYVRGHEQPVRIGYK